jgi:ABC-type multidrug transport system permease subunit
MKSTKSLITLLLFTFSFFAMSQTASAESTSSSVNQELASLVQEADDFLAQNKIYSLAEINYPYSWTTDNVSFITFVSLFSIMCLILITSQYVISERNRRPGKVSLTKS